MSSLATWLQAGAQRLAGSPSARLDAELLLMRVTGLDRAGLIAHGERELAPEDAERYGTLLARRAAGEPVAYLTGAREFWSLPLRVTPAVLIPRPETEVLVERALARLPHDRDPAIADIGTGSGAIAIALAHERPHARIAATDASADALAVAQDNAARLGCTRISFRLGQWLAPLGHETFDLIVSNPPYVRLGDPHLLEGDVRFEPRAALAAGPDGLDAIRAIAFQARAHLARGGWLLLEHGFDQRDAVQTLLRHYGYRDIQTYRDYAGHDRVTEARHGE